jgi:hypothetical protein
LERAQEEAADFIAQTARRRPDPGADHHDQERNAQSAQG